MKMHEVIALQEFCMLAANKKLPIKITYKLSRLARHVEEEIQFYQKEFKQIINDYGLKENGELVYSDGGDSIKIIPGKEEECAEKIAELRDLEVDINITFTIEELENFDLTVAQFNCVLPIIED